MAVDVPATNVASCWQDRACPDGRHTNLEGEHMTKRKRYEVPQVVQLGQAAALTLGDLTDKASDGCCCNKAAAEQ